MHTHIGGKLKGGTDGKDVLACTFMCGSVHDYMIDSSGVMVAS